MKGEKIMVSIFVKTDNKAQAMKEVRCLSTDDKPTAGMPNGSMIALGISMVAM